MPTSASHNSPIRRVITLAWPIVISMLSYTAMDLADAIFVGQIGTAELAAVGLAATTLFMFQSFLNGSLQGVSILSSQATGAEDHDLARRSAVTAVLLALPASLVIIGLGFAAPAILSLMGGEPHVQEMASDYFRIRTYGTPFLLVMLAITNHFQGIGDTRTAMKINLVANGLNIIFDPFLIFGIGPFPMMGVAGAALATIAAQFVGMVMALYVFARRYRERYPFDPKVAATILRLGVPIGVRMILGMTGFTVFTALLARHGTTELAAHQIALRVMSLSFLPGHGIGQATAIMAGNRMGANRFDEIPSVVWAALRVAWVLMGLLGLGFFLFPHFIASIFVDDLPTIELAAKLLMVAAVFQLLDATVMVLVQALNGTGDTRFTMFAGISTSWFIMLPTAWLLSFGLGFGAVGAWCAFVVELPVLVAVLVWRFRRRRALNFLPTTHTRAAVHQ